MIQEERTPLSAQPTFAKVSSDPMVVTAPGARRVDKLISFFSAINLSIRTKILLAILGVVLVLTAIATLVIFQGVQFNRAYDKIISNITAANSINGYIKPAIDTATWAVVAGKSDFDDGEPYAILDDVRSQIRQMIANTDSHRARVKLDVIIRTLNTIEAYVDQMGVQLQSDAPVAESEATLDQIWWVSGLVNELVQDYILFEVNRAEQNYRATQGSFNAWFVVYVVALLGAILFSVAAAWIISESVYVPIKKLHNVTRTITEEDLEVLVNTRNANEIAELGASFNIMIGKIGEMLDSKMTEHENLKKAEFRALQAQINPHFLYNTLDTIVWMAEAGKNQQVIEIVRALSSFFRISLSKGKDWIAFRDEIEHTRSYLTIQKMRYRDILDFSISVDDSLLDTTILKLTLQPLVENALYHGIKNRRDGGAIHLSAHPSGAGRMTIVVEDDGIGLTAAHLEQVRASMEDDLEATNRGAAGFGLANVNKRIQLYYGREYGVRLESTYLVGTRVTVEIPLIAVAEPAKLEGLEPLYALPA